MRRSVFSWLVLAALIVTAPLRAGEEGVKRLTGIINAYPYPSPDGTRIVFQSDRSGTRQIYTMDADGANVRRLTESPLGAETPAWSPDGSRIVYAEYVAAGNNDVFVINADGTGRQRLTDGPGYDGHPHWSGDGRRITFNSDRTTPDHGAPWSDRWHEIFSIASDGGDVRQLTRCRAVCTYGSLSPDGNRLVYRRVDASSGFSWNLAQRDTNSEIYVADADGMNAVNLTRNAAFDGWPRWSPDGRSIAFASNRAGPALVGQIFVMNTDGTETRKVTRGPWSHVQPAWSSDGHSIFAYRHIETAEDEFGDIVVVDVSKP